MTTTGKLREGYDLGLAAAENAIMAAFVARVADLPLADLTEEDAQDLVEPGLADLADNLDALAAEWVRR